MDTFELEKFIFDPSLVLYLPLYELDGASFASKDAYGHLVKDNAGSIWTPKGRLFDSSASQYLDVPDHPALVPAAFSIVFWAKPNSMANWTRWTGKNLYNGTREGWGILRANSDYIYIFLFDDSNNEINSQSIPLNYVEGEWQHFAFTYNNPYVANYLHGRLNGLMTHGAFTLKTSTNPLRIGRAWFGPFYDGYMADYQMYNRVLTPLEIRRNYLATKWRYR